MYGLNDKELSSIRQVFLMYPQIEAVMLYGSRARGDYRPYSDIDIALQSNGLTHGQIADIEARLDDLYLPYSIDLCDIGNITNPALLLNIRREGKQL